MESAVGMQLRSKASPADSIIQSATLHRAEWAVPSAVGRDARVPRWDGRQAGRRAGLEVCANLSWAKAGIINILGSLKRVTLHQLHTSTIRYSDYNFIICQHLNLQSGEESMVAFNGPRNIKPSFLPCGHLGSDTQYFNNDYVHDWTWPYQQNKKKHLYLFKTNI